MFPAAKYPPEHPPRAVDPDPEFEWWMRSRKLETRAAEETTVRELMVAGLSGLVDGQTPRNLEERLVAFIAPGSRPQEDAQNAA